MSEPTREAQQMTSEERIEAIQGRVDAATSGPWEAHHISERVSCVAGKTKLADVFSEAFKDTAGKEANAEFVAHAREDIPFLLDQRRDLKKELAEAEQRRADLVASLNEAGAFLMRVQAELAEARERATAAEAERDEWKALGADTPEALKTIMDLAIDTAVGHNRRLKSERNQLRAELERERGSHAKQIAELGSRIFRRIAALGVAEEPTGGKPE